MLLMVGIPLHLLLLLATRKSCVNLISHKLAGIHAFLTTCLFGEPG